MCIKIVFTQTRDFFFLFVLIKMFERGRKHTQTHWGQVHWTHHTTVKLGKDDDLEGGKIRNKCVVKCTCSPTRYHVITHRSTRSLKLENCEFREQPDIVLGDNRDCLKHMPDRPEIPPNPDLTHPHRSLPLAVQCSTLWYTDVVHHRIPHQPLVVCKSTAKTWQDTRHLLCAYGRGQLHNPTPNGCWQLFSDNQVIETNTFSLEIWGDHHSASVTYPPDSEVFNSLTADPHHRSTDTDLV